MRSFGIEATLMIVKHIHIINNQIHTDKRITSCNWYLSLITPYLGINTCLYAFVVCFSADSNDIIDISVSGKYGSTSRKHIENSLIFH